MASSAVSRAVVAARPPPLKIGRRRASLDLFLIARRLGRPTGGRTAGVFLEAAGREQRATPPRAAPRGGPRRRPGDVARPVARRLTSKVIRGWPAPPPKSPSRAIVRRRPLTASFAKKPKQLLAGADQSAGMDGRLSTTRPRGASTRVLVILLLTAKRRASSNAQPIKTRRDPTHQRQGRRRIPATYRAFPAQARRRVVVALRGNPKIGQFRNRFDLRIFEVSHP